VNRTKTISRRGRAFAHLVIRFLGTLNGITTSLKTAISVEGSLMEQADAAARDLGLRPSGLIPEARDYLRTRRRARTTAQLDQAYAHGSSPEERRLGRLPGAEAEAVLTGRRLLFEGD
jgi:hypothetical protein